MTERYSINLINNDKCEFDRTTGNNKTALLKWARHRGYGYRAILEDKTTGYVYVYVSSRGGARLSLLHFGRAFREIYL